MMKRSLFLLITLMLTLSRGWAYQICANGICYNLHGSEATVTYHDTLYNYDYYKDAITVPESFVYSGRRYTVTEIGDSAFSGCYMLTKLTLPNTIRRIGDYGLYNTGFTTIDLANVEHIGYRALMYSNLTNIKINPDNPYYIVESGVLYTRGHYSAIYYAGNGGDDYNLPNLYVHRDTRRIEDGFCIGKRINNLRLCNGLEWIGEMAFHRALDWSNMRELTIPRTVRHVGKSAFYMSIFVETLNLPDSLEIIEEDAFGFVPATYIKLPKNLRVIRDRAFDCIAGGVYKNLVLPETLDSVGKYAFTSIGADTLIIPSSLRYVSDFSFSDFHGRYLEIRPQWDSIPAYAFYGCSAHKVNLPPTIKRIGLSAFWACYNLAEINLPEGLEEIGGYALAGNHIPQPHFPSTLRSLGWMALSDNVCVPREYFFHSTTPPDCEESYYIFDGVTMEQSILNVPTGSRAAYAAKKPWSLFGTIREFDASGIVNISDERPDSPRYTLYGTRLQGRPANAQLIIEGNKKLIIR